MVWKLLLLPKVLDPIVYLVQKLSRGGVIQGKLFDAIPKSKFSLSFTS